MHTVVADEIIASLQTVENDVSGLRRRIAAETLSDPDRQYLARCFDLLEMELEALRQHIEGLR